MNNTQTHQPRNSAKNPCLALVGRPNVGKSTLFNRLIGKREAIVENRPGITRDRHYGESDWNGLTFRLIDTGGISDDPESVYHGIVDQIELALLEAQLIFFVVDAQAGLLPEDKVIIDRLRKVNKPICLVINKVDVGQHEQQCADFYKIGLENTFLISAEFGKGIGELLDYTVEELRKGLENTACQVNLEEASIETPIIRLAIVGKPNVGKSSLLNQILGEDRAIVFDEAGTTRDPLSEYFEIKEQAYQIIDTAGIKRKKSSPDFVDKVSILKALKSLEKSHVALLVCDATRELDRQTMKVLNFALERGRACLLLMNKWDLVHEKKLAEIKSDFRKRYPRLAFIPWLALSAKTGRGIHKLFPKINEIYQNYNIKISTAQLNAFFEEIKTKHPHPNVSGRSIQLKYITQIAVRPMSLLIFCNHPDLVTQNYQQFFENQLRQKFLLEAVPIKIKCAKST